MSVNVLKSFESSYCVFKSPTHSDRKLSWMFRIVLRNSFTIKSLFFRYVIFRNDMFYKSFIIFKHDFEHESECDFERDFECDFEHESERNSERDTERDLERDFERDF